MANVSIEPTKDKPVPYDLRGEKTDTMLDEMAVAGNTAELQEALGANFDLDEADVDREKELIEAVVKQQEKKLLTQPNTAFAAAAFLRT